MFNALLGSVPRPTFFRGSTYQVCGLWPFSVGSAIPLIGVPVGHHQSTGAVVCFDPISWFERAKIISNPSLFVLAQPGLGKSSFIKHLLIGLAARGIIPLIVGDLKPDYVLLIRALGGQVIEFGHGRGHLNPLDMRIGAKTLALLPEEVAHKFSADMHNRQVQLVSGLIDIMRPTDQGLTERESMILDQAITEVTEEIIDRQPVIGDVLSKIRNPSQAMRLRALDRGDNNKYQNTTEGLEASLMALNGAGIFGDAFAHETDVDLSINSPLVFDISSITDSEQAFQAAALLTCWTMGFAGIEAQNVLADNNLAKRRNYFIVMDELWRVLSAGSKMVARIDALTRTNRTRGVGQAMITHTMADFDAIPSEEDRAKARGFVSRSGVVVTGGLPKEEMPFLRGVVGLSRAEENKVTSWTTPPGWEKLSAPPGRGKFLIKVGGRPGIPINVRLTNTELTLTDTNQRWEKLQGNQ